MVGVPQLAKTFPVVEHRLHPGLGRMKRAAAFRPGSREPAHPCAAWDLKYRRPERLLVEPPAKTGELPRPGLNRPVPVAGAGEAVAQDSFHPSAKVLALREVLDRPSRNGSRRIFPLLPRYSRSANAGCSIRPCSLNRPAAVQPFQQRRIRPGAGVGETGNRFPPRAVLQSVQW